jgi:hypothetical protein
MDDAVERGHEYKGYDQSGYSVIIHDSEISRSALEGSLR